MAITDWSKKDSGIEVVAEELQERIFGLDPCTISDVCFTSATTAEKCLLLEYAQFSRILPPDGFYLLPTKECMRRWDGVIFMNQGPFEGRTIRFLILISENYPNEKPEIICTQPVPLHPLINQTTGMLDTTPAFPHWTSNGWINDLLQYFEQILLLQNATIDWVADYICDNSPNEAGQLLLKSKDLYLRRVKNLSGKNFKYLEDDDTNSAIKFKVVDPMGYS